MCFSKKGFGLWFMMPPVLLHIIHSINAFAQGGGIYLHSGTLNVHGSQIYDNTATNVSTAQSHHAERLGNGCFTMQMDDLAGWRRNVRQGCRQIEHVQLFLVWEQGTTGIPQNRT